MVVQTRTPAKVELVSKKSRRDLQEYFVSTTLRTISQDFGDADIACDDNFIPNDSGARRCLVQQYYATLDFSKWSDVRKFLSVYAGVLAELEIPNPDRWLGDSQRRYFSSMKATIRRDGFDYHDGKLVPVAGLPAAAKLKEDATRIDAPNLIQQIERIENQIDNDPDLAIGTSKELIETVCKTILVDRNVMVDKKWELMELVKRTREELKLVPDGIPESAKAADTIRKLLGQLAAITQSLAELRNAYGTGHGRDGRAKGLTPRHARLASGAACVLAKFLFETHQHRSDAD
jgi:Abortive infection C-terminus